VRALKAAKVGSSGLWLSPARRRSRAIAVVGGPFHFQLHHFEQIADQPANLILRQLLRSQHGEHLEHARSAHCG